MYVPNISYFHLLLYMYLTYVAIHSQVHVFYFVGMISEVDGILYFGEGRVRGEKGEGERKGEGEKRGRGRKGRGEGEGGGRGRGGGYTTFVQSSSCISCLKSTPTLLSHGLVTLVTTVVKWEDTT